MGKDNFSFDIVSEADLQEVDNAVNQAKKELAQRFDFKGSKSSIDYSRAEKKIKLLGDDDFKLRSVKEILANKLAKRSVSMKLLTFGEEVKVFGGCIEQMADLACGDTAG
jgi:uncharacterized protein YajQ (UPF0234 family)